MTKTGQSTGEAATQLAQWVQTQEQLKAAGADSTSLDLQILPFKDLYVRNGAKYGANSAGMVRWFAELTPDAVSLDEDGH